MNIYKSITALLPEKIVASYENTVRYTDMTDLDCRSYIGFTWFLGIGIGVVVFLLLQILFQIDILIAIPAGIIAAVIIITSFYIYIVLSADNKAKRIEKVLPDALQLIAANMRAGMTVDKAVWLSAREEFGTLEEELRKMAAQTLGGKSITEAMEEATKRVKSKTLERSFMLLEQGIELGGEVAHLLTEIAHDIRKTQALQREIAATTAMYSIFIIFASMLAAPALFAVSTFYVESTNILWAGQEMPDISTVEERGIALFQVGEVGMSGEQVRLFAVSCITLTTFFAALILGLIRNGTAKKGIKFIPLFVSFALVIYFIAYEVIKAMFGSLIM